MTNRERLPFSLFPKFPQRPLRPLFSPPAIQGFLSACLREASDSTAPL